MSETRGDSPITIKVKLEEAVFRRFAIFDTLVRQKHWRPPVVFCLILAAFSTACFLMTDKSQSALIGTVLALVALSLPVVYFASFFNSVKAYAKKEKLPRYVYELTLTGAADGIGIRSLGDKRESADYEWANVYAAYRRKGCTYLYMTAAKAFLLPDGQASVPDDELWSFIESHVPQGKAFGLKGQQSKKGKNSCNSSPDVL